MNYERSIQKLGWMKKYIFSSDSATAVFAAGSGCRQESKRNKELGPFMPDCDLYGITVLLHCSVLRPVVTHKF